MMSRKQRIRAQKGEEEEQGGVTGEGREREERRLAIG